MDEPQRAACVVCGAALSRNVAVRLGPSFLCSCNHCGSWTYLPRPSAAEQAAIHDNPEYYEHPYFNLRRTITSAQRRRCRDLFARLSTGVESSSLVGERLLDIGCDTGTFLKTASEQFGIVPVGLDVSERAVQEAVQQGVEAYRSKIEDAPAHLADFQVITAIDLLEHVPDPAAFLREVRQRLRPGGVLYLETPNIRSVVYRFGKLLAAVTGGRPAGLIARLFPEQHIQYFTPTSLHSVARKAGYEVVQLGCRVLPASDIAASLVPLLAIGALQAFDRLLKTEILIWAVFRRPPARSQ